MPKTGAWETLPMPLTGPMDSRSRPADLGPRVLRFKLNMAVNSSGKLSRRAGFSALSFGSRSDNPELQTNWDHHRQGATREPITLLSEITSPDNLRYLFDGTSKRVSWLDNGTSGWHDIITDGAADSRWKIASLRDKVVLVNGVDPPRVHTLGDTAPAAVLDLSGAESANGNIVVSYQNVIVMFSGNLVQWSDFRDASRWNLAPVVPDSTIAGFQYLDDGEQILNTAELGGVLYIFTDRAIWRMFPNVTATSIFGFHRWYGEPTNRTACLAYENALVATGKEFFWFGRTSVYWMNQFSSAPISPDWLLRASGLVFESSTALDPAFCESPVGGFVPDAAGSSKEVWFSYPRLGSVLGVNDYSIVLSFNTDSTVSPYTTADYVDAGFTAFTNFSRTTEAGVTCSTNPVFIGAFGEDYTLKSIGGVFRRDIVTLVGDDVTVDIPDNAYAVTARGYSSQLMLMCPFPLEHREKILRVLRIAHDTIAQDVPNLFRLRIGGSYMLADPLSTQPNCGVLWHVIDDLPAACPDVEPLADLADKGLRQDDATEFQMNEQARLLYADLKIVAPDGTAPIGTDTAFSNISFEYLLLP